MKLDLWLAVILAMLLPAGCGGAGTSTPADTSLPATSTPPPTTPAGTMAGSMAEEGRGVYAVICSPCHGAQGQGSSEAALIGPGASLSQYGTAGALLAFISRAMPYGDPGSLTAAQYNQVTAFLVVEDGLVNPAAVWEELADIGLSGAR